MNTALIIMGIPRLSKEKTEQLLIKYSRVFPDADVWYHTWDNKVHLLPDNLDETFILSCPEPEITYHPLVDTPTLPNVSERYTNKKSSEVGKENPAPKTRQGHLQILGYADAVESIPPYDLYIRARCDVEISTEANFKPFLEKALEGPVGFSPYQPGILSHNLCLPEKQKMKIAWGDTPLGQARDYHDWHKWHCWLCDQLIFHKREHFDPQHVWRLHEEKKLHPIEAGWWQVMSEPYGGDIHSCVWNGIAIRK
jgi:hypothetical protein